MTVSLTSDLCAQGKHEWCMNRSQAESHCQCPCHKSSKEDNELIQRVCRGVASIQEGERLRAYIAGLQSALERSQHQITLLVGSGRIPLKRAICARHGQIVETGCPDCERALGRIPVETSSQLSEDARDAARYRVVRVSSITGAVLAHELDAACDVIIATRNAVKASVRCTCFEDEHSQDCEENGCCGQCTGAAQNGEVGR